MTTCLSCLTTVSPDKEHRAAAETNWEDSGRAERREDMPVHSMSCNAKLEEFGRGQKEEGGDDMSCQPPRNPPAGIHLG